MTTTNEGLSARLREHRFLNWGKAMELAADVLDEAEAALRMVLSADGHDSAEETLEAIEAVLAKMEGRAS